MVGIDVRLLSYILVLKKIKTYQYSVVYYKIDYHNITIIKDAILIITFKSGHGTYILFTR